VPDGQQHLGVVVVTYNSEHHLSAMLCSLPAAAGSLTLRVVVVDNGSTDRTVETARGRPGIEVVETGANLGYSGGINVGREVLGPGPLAILNPDLTLAPGALEILMRALQADVGIVAPLLLDGSGRVFPHLHTEPSILGTLGDSLFGDRWARRPRRLSDTFRRPEDYRTSRDVGWAGGAAWVVSEACDAAVGAWDSARYFLYSEETDYARRSRDLGFRVRFVPEAVVTHHGGGSGFSPALLALMAVNRVRYYSSHHGSARTRVFSWSVAARHLLRAWRGAHRRAFGAVVRPGTWAQLPHATRPAPRLPPKHER
jgi:N-acetylglucosaminyl-diphospho-decaprenol L-rhamnosyltransferase